MRFLVFMIPAGYQPSSFAKASADSSQRGASGEKDGRQQNPDFSADPKKAARLMAAMGKFNDELKLAGALRSVDGLAPLAKGARLAFTGGKPTVTDGPAVDSKEVVGGYWLVEAKTKQQVVDWWKRCPAEDGDVIEIRQVAEMADFPAELQKALQEQGVGNKEQGAATKPQRTVTRAPHSVTGAPGPWKKSKGSRSKEQD